MTHEFNISARKLWPCALDDVIKWKHFPRYWPFVWGIHRSLVNSPHKFQWRGALMFSLIWSWINACVNNREAGDLRRNRAHYDVIIRARTIVYCWIRYRSILCPLINFNILSPSDAIWCHKSWSALAQVMTCCLTAPSHYLIQSKLANLSSVRSRGIGLRA